MTQEMDKLIVTDVGFRAVFLLNLIKSFWISGSAGDYMACN